MILGQSKIFQIHSLNVLMHNNNSSQIAITILPPVHGTNASLSFQISLLVNHLLIGLFLKQQFIGFYEKHFLSE
jgi:hypothetical protein